jgi:predicted LPLAT superfamily acyltransferase
MTWTGQKERGSVGALRLMAWIVTRLGYGFGYLLLWPIAGYFFVSSPRQRRAMRHFQRRALGRAPRLREVFRPFFVFAATILDRLFLLDGQRKGYDLRVVGLDLLNERIAAGRGCILLGAHLGSFNAMHAVADTGCPVEVVSLMHTQNATKSAEFFAEWGARHGRKQPNETVIPLGQPDAMLRAAEALGRGGLVGILADRTPGTGKVVRLPFLGDAAAFPLGPHILAGVLDAPVMLAFGAWTGKRSYEVHFEPFAERIVLDRRERQAQLEAVTRDYASRIEAIARRFPDNWFNFYDFWEEMDA